MIGHAWTGRCSRRAIILGVAGVAGLRFERWSAAGRETPPSPTVTGNCAVEPGVQLLIDWRLGKPVVPISQLIPPIDWVLYTHPTLPLVFRYPPDWTPYAFWADSFTPGGAPRWLDEQPPFPQLTLARVVAPRENAVFEFGVGTIKGPPLAPAQAAFVAEQGLFGENPPLISICTYEDPNPLAPSWFHADRLGGGVLVSGGTAIGQPSLFMPSTIVTYQNAAGPREEFEALARTVLLPILTQFLGGGGDDDEDDEDDEDDDNGD